MKKILLFLLAIISISCKTNNNVDVNDYPIVTTIQTVAEYYDLKVDLSGKYETTSTTRYFDGSTELAYTYELLETEVYDPLYYSITIEKEVSEKDAKQLFLMGKGAINLIGKAYEQESKEITTLELPGDESFYAYRTVEGETIGMYYIIRKGKCVYTMLINGVYTKDHSLVIDLLNPKIENLEEFELKKSEG
ncbi:hypothetical protein KMW28_22780 [Flammeovirga yaeyamensis]|uniref:Lipoprotein n=1 Tax=Flammeovirga yaeyamensis TaxID=367791 RepID=A0AAX1NCH1_9BACT|nr:hypothetical protein [Flammeovirga yaeyamensis]MBB3696812.1 hypothetical protein [Flammeovirga yaeyamensis]NMF33477.1 hypothetical protein [Flammeovirga yaeyamensis]QWG05249.1 hypothetical protein KMW28_22780 [Flammeovirga yaeyamensis]